MRGSAGVAVAAVAVLVGLSGCTGDEPGPGPTTSVETPTPGPTPTPTPSVELPTLPPEATVQDAAGAEAFVRYWFDLVNYGYQTADSDPVSAASSADCVECGTYVDVISQLTRDGSLASTPPISVSEAATAQVDGTDAYVSIAYVQLAFDLVAPDGSIQSVPGQDPERGAAITTWIAGQWRMFGIGA